MSTDDERALVLLKAIRDLATLLYPFPEGADIDPRKTFALGQIGGLAMKAIHEHGTKPGPLTDPPPSTFATYVQGAARGRRRRAEEEPRMRSGHCAGCGADGVIFLTSWSRYRCAECFEKETGYWPDGAPPKKGATE